MDPIGIGIPTTYPPIWVVSKNRGKNPPKWMVKIIHNGKTRMNQWMIWGEHPLFKETPRMLILPRESKTGGFLGLSCFFFSV